MNDRYAHLKRRDAAPEKPAGFKPRRHCYTGTRPAPEQEAKIRREAVAGFKALREQLSMPSEEEVAQLKSAAPKVEQLLLEDGRHD